MKRESFAVVTRPRLSMMLDSGAFSAWTQRKPLSRKQYSEFIAEHGSAFDHIANLDVIPGTRGHRSSTAQVMDAAEASLRNFAYLRQKGCPVFPVYHYGEPEDQLKRLLDLAPPIHCNFLALGALVGVNHRDRRKWLDSVFKVIASKAPGLLVHGFGLTDFRLMKAYPWHSVDSMSWLILSTTGVIYVPTGSDRIITMTLSKDVKQRNSGFHSLGPNEVRVVREWIAKIGSSEEKLMESYLERGYANIMAIFHVLRDTKVKVFLTASSNGYNEVLARANSRHRLFSYFDLRKRKDCDPNGYSHDWGLK